MDNECTCECHTNKSIMHFDACCEGPCIWCEKAYTRGLREHEKMYCPKKPMGKLSKAMKKMLKERWN